MFKTYFEALEKLDFECDLFFLSVEKKDVTRELCNLKTIFILAT